MSMDTQDYKKRSVKVLPIIQLVHDRAGLIELWLGFNEDTHLYLRKPMEVEPGDYIVRGYYCHNTDAHLYCYLKSVSFQENSVYAVILSPTIETGGCCKLKVKKLQENM